MRKYNYQEVSLVKSVRRKACSPERTSMVPQSIFPTNTLAKGTTLRSKQNFSSKRFHRNNT